MFDTNRKDDSANPSPLGQLENRLQEAYEELWGTFVDPREALFDGDGLPWSPVGFDGLGGGFVSCGPTS